MFICSCHRKGCALQSSIPLTRAALSNRGNLSCNTLGVEVPSLCVFAVNEFGSLWNFHLNWLKTNVEAECCVCVHVRDEAMKTCTQVSPQSTSPFLLTSFDLLFRNAELRTPLLKEFSILNIMVNGKDVKGLYQTQMLSEKKWITFFNMIIDFLDNRKGSETIYLDFNKAVSHGNLVKWKRWELNCRNCNLGRKLVRGEIAVGTGVLGYFARSTLFNIFSNHLGTKNRNVLRKPLMLQMLKMS